MQISPAMLQPFDLNRGYVEIIQSRVSYVAPNLLTIGYVAEGELARLKIPAQISPRRADRLWEHTCFEAFLRIDEDPSYYEFNFSPSGEWAAYSFLGYRDGEPIDDVGVSGEIVVRRSANRIELDAVVHLDRLPAIRLRSTLRLGLSAVIENNDGTLSYWALKHPVAKPDFHHPDSFALEMAFSGQSA
jgi:hypothetical protein